MKKITYLIALITVLVTLSSSVQAQRHSASWQKVDNSQYPHISTSMFVVNEHGRIISPTQISENGIKLYDSSANIPFTPSSIQSMPQDSLPPDPIEGRGVALLISIDVSKGCSTVYGPNGVFVKNMLNRLVNSMDLTEDEIAIQIIRDTVVYALDYTQDNGAIRNAINSFYQFIDETKKFDVVDMFLNEHYGINKMIGRHQYRHPVRGALIITGSSYDSVFSERVPDPYYQRFTISGHAHVIYFKPGGVEPYADTGKGYYTKYTKWGYMKRSVSGNTGSLNGGNYSFYNINADTNAYIGSLISNFQYEAYVRYGRPGAYNVDFSFILPDTTETKKTVIVTNEDYQLHSNLHILNPMRMSVGRESKPIEISVYPNPASHYLFVNDTKHQSFSILDGTGTVKAEGYTNEQISLSSLAPGAYFGRLEDGKFFKLIVTR